MRDYQVSIREERSHQALLAATGPRCVGHPGVLCGPALQPRADRMPEIPGDSKRGRRRSNSGATRRIREQPRLLGQLQSAISRNPASGARTGPAALARQEAGGLLCAVRADLPGFCRSIGHACGPKSPAFTRVVWGLTRRPPGSPGGLSSGFPFARRGSSASSAFGWFPFLRRSPLFPFGRCPVPVPLRFPSGFPFPWAIFTLAPPRAGSAGVGPGRQGPRSAVLPRPPRLGRPRSARAAGGQRPGTRDAAAGSPVTSGRERTTSSRPAAIAERDRNAGLPGSLSPTRRGRRQRQ
jgi:hypothetical protein